MQNYIFFPTYSNNYFCFFINKLSFSTPKFRFSPQKIEFSPFIQHFRMQKYSKGLSPLPHLTASYCILPKLTAFYRFLPHLTAFYRLGGRLPSPGRQTNGKRSVNERLSARVAQSGKKVVAWAIIGPFSRYLAEKCL